ncbi:MAG: bifunctional serine/threonine-protein kinase/formylglycine-generating enzyme family protein, partial [Dokdonella sp.]
LARGDLSERDFRDDEAGLVELLRVMLDALGYAHARGIVHRDVKAENVLFDNANRPQLADFGIALAQTEGDSRVTGDGLAIGSSAYMSPEQARASAIDGRSDLYSLGVLTYEQLTGTLPYRAPDSLSVALMHAQDPIPRLPDDRAHWQDFIDCAMAKQPDLRHRNAQAMQRALDPIAEHLRRRHNALWRTVVQLRSSPVLLTALGALLSVTLLTLGLQPWRSTADALVAATAGVDIDETADAVLAAPLENLVRLLADARAQRAIGSVLAPPGANAAESYLAVLALERGNPEATAGIDEVLGSVAASLLDGLPSARRSELEPQLAQLNALGQRAMLAADSTFSQQRERLAAAALERARALVAAYQRDEAMAWLGLAEMLGTRDAAWALVHTQAGALVEAGAAARDPGGPPMRAVPPRIGNSSIAKPLLVMRDEVARGDYAQFATQTGREATRCRNRLSPLRMFDRRDWRNPGFTQTANEPVVCVSFNDAQAYARWLGTRTGQRYLLPTRAQWRHAAQAGSSRGSACARGNVLDASATGVSRHPCDDGVTHTAASGRFAVNSLGLNDLLGNVAEWALDCANTASTRPQDRCNRRSVIGLSWRDGPSDVAERLLDADRGYDDVGFRLVREL